MKKSKVVLLTFIIGIMLSMTPTALAGKGDNITSGGQSDCPAGTYSVAKVQFDEIGDGVNITINESADDSYGQDFVNVTVTGFNQGYWNSSPYQIKSVIYKIDGPNVMDPNVTYDPWTTNDSFNHSSYQNAISHIEFCATSTTPPVPELPTIALTSIGLLGVLFFYRRFK